MNVVLEKQAIRKHMHDFCFRYGIRPPKVKIVNLARRFYNYFGFSHRETSLNIVAFYDYKTKTILLSPSATLKDLEHELIHHMQYLKNPGEFVIWEKKMEKLAKGDLKVWLKAYYNSHYERVAFKRE